MDRPDQELKDLKNFKYRGETFPEYGELLDHEALSKISEYIDHLESFISICDDCKKMVSNDGPHDCDY
jgi:hypothetical protein